MERQQDAGLPATTFFSRTYDEALDLVYEARDYLVHDARDEWRTVEPAVGLACSTETTRLTARLTALMTWLLLQRAVQQGEITALDACEEAPELASIKPCVAPPSVDPAALPGQLGSLLDRSERLYRRVARLDEMVRRDVLGSEGPTLTH